MKIFSHRFRYRRAGKNYRLNSGLPDPDRLINGQAASEDTSSMRYGRFRMGYNGCEIIAVYNALRLLGIRTTLAEVAREAEEMGYTWLAGLFGTRPRAVGRHLEHRGLRTVRAKRQAEAEELAGRGGVFVFVFWNRKANPFRGIHTVAARSDGGAITVYNMYTDSTSSRTYGSVKELIGRGRLIYCYSVSLPD